MYKTTTKTKKILTSIIIVLIVLIVLIKAMEIYKKEELVSAEKTTKVVSENAPLHSEEVVGASLAPAKWEKLYSFQNYGESKILDVREGKILLFSYETNDLLLASQTNPADQEILTNITKPHWLEGVVYENYIVVSSVYGCEELGCLEDSSELVIIDRSNNEVIKDVKYTGEDGRHVMLTGDSIKDFELLFYDRVVDYEGVKATRRVSFSFSEDFSLLENTDREEISDPETDLQETNLTYGEWLTIPGTDITYSRDIFRKGSGPIPVMKQVEGEWVVITPVKEIRARQEATKVSDEEKESYLYLKKASFAENEAVTITFPFDVEKREYVNVNDILVQGELVWFATNYGLVKFDTTTLEYDVLSEDDGLPGNPFGIWFDERFVLSEADGYVVYK